MADGTNDSGLNGRVLTTGEIALARSIFGDSIDYTEVRIFEGLTSDGAAASAIGSNIFFPTETFLNDYSDLSDALRGEAGTFLHEMTHVWQDQNGVDITASQIEAVEQVGGDYTAIYDYRLEQGKEFSDYNIEQQARIVEDYYRLSEGLPQAGGFPTPLSGAPSIGEYLDIMRFDEPPEEAPEDIAAAPEPRIAPINEDGTPIGGEPPVPPVDAEPRIRPINEDGSPVEAGTPPAAPAPEPTLTPTVAPIPQEPTDEGPSGSGGDGPTLGELTGQEGPPNGDDGIPVEDDAPPPGFDDRSAEEIGEELEAVLRGEDTGQDDDSDADDSGDDAPEDEGEQETAGSSDTPNPIDDPVPGNGDVSVLTNRNGNATNPGSGDFDLAGVDGDIFDLIDRNDPATNPGSGDFDTIFVSGDFTDLLDRNDPAINTGFGDFDLPTVEGDLADLLDRGGPQQTFEVADTELAGATLDDGLLSDFDFGSSLEDVAALEIG